jgi:hypothetical protein
MREAPGFFVCDHRESSILTYPKGLVKQNVAKECHLYIIQIPSATRSDNLHTPIGDIPMTQRSYPDSTCKVSERVTNRWSIFFF